MVTPVFKLGQDLTEFVLRNVPADLISDGIIIAVTSKIVSLAENRIVKRSSIDKASLIAREADRDLGEVAYKSRLTIKEGLLVIAAGIDESNSETGDYILYPEKPFEAARQLHSQLKKAWSIKYLGIILTDSRTTPLRYGVTGVSLAHWGFRGVDDKVGQPDLFGRSLKMTTVTTADALASIATFAMGESNESQPLAVVSGANVEFTEFTTATEIRVPLEQDLYYPFIRAFINHES